MNMYSFAQLGEEVSSGCVFLTPGCKTMSCTSVHSPFLLTMSGARIYNLDETPVNEEKVGNQRRPEPIMIFWGKHRELSE